MMEHIDFPKNFGQVSGIEISQGERVVKALQKLWQKLQLLEQAGQLEKADTAREKNETTFPELQQKLLELQFQYVRKLLRENNCPYVPCGKTDQGKGFSENEGIASPLHKSSGHISTRNCYDKHTQTDSVSAKSTNSVYSSDEISPVGSIKNPNDAQPLKGENAFVLPDFHQLKIGCGATAKPRVIDVGLKQRNSQTHYHLRLSDVPFIIGTSTSSHSVVANVQKIISMMKVHNKGLCSSVPNHPRRSQSLDLKKHNTELGYQRIYSSPDLSEHCDLKNRLLSLSDELKALTLKLQCMENTGKSGEHSYMDHANILNLIEMKTRQIIALQKAVRKHTGQQFLCKQHRPFWESSPCSHCSEKLIPASNDTSAANRLSKTEMKQVIGSYSDSSSKVDCFERRKMVRELKEFQVHLQQEDIHWK